MASKDDPSACHCCGRHAVGIGLGRTADDPRWLCRECIDIIEHIRSAKRLDAYELKAREGGMDAAGAVIEKYGPNLADYEEHQALELCGVIWKGCADRLRTLIVNQEAPF